MLLLPDGNTPGPFADSEPAFGMLTAHPAMKIVPPCTSPSAIIGAVRVKLPVETASIDPPVPVLPLTSRDCDTCRVPPAVRKMSPPRPSIPSLRVRIDFEMVMFSPEKMSMPPPAPPGAASLVILPFMITVPLSEKTS